MSHTVDFDVELFEQRLMNLKDTQDGIQQMSTWCLQQRVHHKKIVNCWLSVLKQVRVEHRLTLFYLANDVIQYSKRKNYEFVESWATALQKATTMVRDEKVRNKIFRIFKIWEQREIYTEEYLSDLNGLLSMNPVKKTQPQNNTDPDDFQNSVLVSNIRECVRLGAYTDKTFKRLPKVPNCDTEIIKHNLKDKSHSEDVEREIDDYVNSLERYIKSLREEIKSRKSLINNIEQAETFYTNQRGEVKVVVNAYKNFGNRIKVVKKKLEEITPNLPSPIPSPDINAPSPEQDDDIDLPDENNFATNFLRNKLNGYTSYMDGNLPFDINDFKRESPRNPYEIGHHNSKLSQPIQVINSRNENKANSYDAADYYKPIDTRSYSAQGVPLPVPPVSNYSMSDSSTNPYISNDLDYDHNSAYDPQTSVYSSDTSYMTNTTNNNYERNLPLMPPPPMPPLLGDESEDFNSTWDMDMTWTSLDSSNSFNHVLDTPVPPSPYEREAVNSNITEYVDGKSEDFLPLQDVDHRQLHIPPAVNLKNQLKDKGRFVDVDHRNLISLTGSPISNKGPEKKKLNLSWSNADKDFRPNLIIYPSAKHDNNVQIPMTNTDFRTNLDKDYRRALQEIPKEITPVPPVTTPKTPSSSSESTPSSQISLPPAFSAILESSITSPKTNEHSDAADTVEDTDNKPDESTSETTNSSSDNSTAKMPPPPLPPPSLEAPVFDFLSPPPNMFNPAMPPPNFVKGDSTQEINSSGEVSPVKVGGKAGNKVNNPNDNVESIDMEMSDDDIEDYIREDNSNLSDQEPLEEPILSSEGSSDATSPTTPTQPTFRAPLLTTPPALSNQPPWEHLNNLKHVLQQDIAHSNDGGNEIQNPWKSPRMSGNLQFPRGQFMPPPRNFSPNMKQNFRGHHPMSPMHNPPYFNRGGRGGRMRGGPGRRNFRAWK